ncbi:Na+/H+ antiporter NhaC family protein [uncultured Vagococcus sp.]|uniref:Na+/H+ antiporter NhaC family protein n=1 Tax=uncultured Vagococcus sp. TaxID=189676 RepID=UPI0028D8F10B|nr:Na+/H+ antiporter NhaC family protein [uncultured Vagococcus sp.]
MERNVSVKQALSILIILLTIIGTSIIRYHLAVHVALLIALIMLIAFAVFKGMSWDDMHHSFISGITPGLIPILIFLLIGALISTWIASGTIPTLMVYGFSFLSPTYFLPLIFLICGLVGAAVGSSFTTISTVGIAFYGMGQLLGFESAWIAGAIISGAFFGNSLSPLSDTANLAAAIAGVDLFKHIKQMVKTVFPTALISILFFFILGRGKTVVGGTHEMTNIVACLINNFAVTPVALLPILLLFICAWKKIPAIPTLLANIILSLSIRFLYYPRTGISQIGTWLQEGYVATTGNQQVDDLLTRGGIQSMMWSVSLIILALAFGGLLVRLQIIEILLETIQSWMNRPGKLVLLTALSCIGVNIMIGEQYLSIILPGKAYQKSFDRLGVPRTYLSRTLSDAGASLNPLIPWSVSGVFITGTLGISTSTYWPFAIFCYMLPLMTIGLGVAANYRLAYTKLEIYDRMRKV